MESRMEKYYEDDLKVLPARTKRNEGLYKSLSSGISEFDSLPIPDNSNVIDADGLKQIISSRDEYRKSRQSDRVSSLNRPLREDEIREDKKKDDKIYDINVLLENAKNEINRSATITNERKIDVNFLNGLEDANIPSSDDAMEIASPEIEKDKISNTDSLPLDILADLKGSDNTVVTDPIVKDEVTMIKKIKDGETFYSGSFNFSKKDFDEEDDEMFFEEESHSGIKTFFLVLGLLVLAVGIAFVIMKYVL